jgi:hypothetical protein
MGPDKNLPSEEVVQDALQKTRKSFAYANFTTAIFTKKEILCNYEFGLISKHLP